MIKKLFYTFLFIAYSVSLIAMDSPQGAVWNFETIEPVYAHDMVGMKVALKNIKMDSSTIVSKMRDNPRDLLLDCKKYNTQFHSATNEMSEDKISALNPIFLLDECSTTHCGFTRKENRQFCPRSLALDHIKSDVLPNIAKKEITLASYACGDLFFELELMINLHDNGYQVKNLILIDPMYLALIKLMRAQFIGEISHETLIKKLDSLGNQHDIYKKFMRLKQFLSIVNALHGNVELHLFSHAFAYAHAQKPTVVEADICIAMDFSVGHRNEQDYFMDFEAILTTKIGYLCNLVTFTVQNLPKGYSLRTFIHRREATGGLVKTETLSEMWQK